MRRSPLMINLLWWKQPVWQKCPLYVFACVCSHTTTLPPSHRSCKVKGLWDWGSVQHTTTAPLNSVSRCNTEPFLEKLLSHLCWLFHSWDRSGTSLRKEKDTKLLQENLHHLPSSSALPRVAPPTYKFMHQNVSWESWGTFPELSCIL